MFCRCKRNKSAKGAQVKDYEMDSVRPSIVAQQSQAPPPYYPASGLENKALEHSMDLALAALDDPKGSSVYATQNGYGYHPQQTLLVPGAGGSQHMAGNECKCVDRDDGVLMIWLSASVVLFSSVGRSFRY